MSKIILFTLTCSLFLSLGLVQNSFADRRSYVWTYEYMTMPKGMWELEYYLTAEIPNINKSNINAIKPWVELEYGITNNWDVSLYQIRSYTVVVRKKVLGFFWCSIWPK